MGDGIIAGLVHLLSIHKREREGFEASVDVHEIKGSDWGGLSDEGDISGDEVGSANMVDKDSMMKIVTFREETIKGVGELGRKNDRFPFSMVCGSIEMGHRVMEAFLKVGVRGGRS